MSELASSEQIAEYESQLAGIEQLLAASPNDESLLTLKKDLEELLALTRSGTAAGAAVVEPDLPIPPPPMSPPENFPLEQAVAAGAAAAAIATEDDKPTVEDDKDKKKKTKKLKDFVVPPHLIINETDSEADKKKKRRALKALKSQHREKRKEVEHEQKQKSWQSFQKKKRVGGDSIFSTQDTVDDRVGVISKKTKTEFGSRKRHKHAL